MITTLYNEASSVEELVGSLLAQTRLPDEIVVTDAGSTDGTRARLEEFGVRHSRLRVLDVAGSRSRGRNAAIAAASHPLIACIDGGCVAEPEWLERLVEPLEGGGDWVAGFYLPAGPTLLSTCLGLVMVYVLEEVDPETFWPSTRSMAFRRVAWEAVGGFPEEVDFAEDTLFDARLAEAGYRPVFAPGAVVRWRPPAGLVTLARTLFRWGRGDGLVSLRGYAYKRLLAVYGGTLSALVVALRWAPWALLLVLAPLALSTYRSTRRKYRWAKGPLKYLYIPAAHLVATAAGSLGWLVGAVIRKWGGRR